MRNPATLAVVLVLAAAAGAQEPALSAKLVDAASKARQRAATVEVKGQGHLSLHGLASGNHEIKVALAANDHRR